MQRKLKVDGSSLWIEPEDQFVLRFNDLNEIKQQKFAERIKATAPQHSIRKESGPAKEAILSFLKEINPVIYTEGSYVSSNTSQSYRRWNSGRIFCLSSWSFQRLSKAIYRFLCLNREPNNYELRDALILSTNGVSFSNNPASRSRILDEITNALQTETSCPTIRTSAKEVGLNEIQQARERAERTY